MDAVTPNAIPNDPIRHMQNMAGSLGQIVIIPTGTNECTLEIKDDNTIAVTDAGGMIAQGDLCMMTYKYPQRVHAMCINCVEIFGQSVLEDPNALGATADQIYVETSPYPAPDTESPTPVSVSINRYKACTSGTKIFGQFKKIVVQKDGVLETYVPATVRIVLHFGWELN